MIEYASGEFLLTIGTHNGAADKSCMVHVMELVIDIKSVGRILPVYNLTKCLTSSNAFLK